MMQPEIDRIIKKLRIGVGNDAELFLQNQDNKYISSIGIVPGTKQHPHETKHGWVQQDNVAGEINILPAYTVWEFVNSTSGVMEDLSTIIKPLQLKLSVVASAIFEAEQLNNKIACVAGCDPDWNAYTKEENIPPDMMDIPLRAGGGHLHLSWDGVDDEEDARERVVKAGDVYITLPGLLLDDDDQRRKLYGKAGAYRPKKYGVELRSMSNFWAKSKELMAWAYYGAALSVINRNEDLPNVEDVINNNNKKEAKEIINAYQIPMPAWE